MLAEGEGNIEWVVEEGDDEYVIFPEAAVKEKILAYASPSPRKQVFKR